VLIRIDSQPRPSLRETFAVIISVLILFSEGDSAISGESEITDDDRGDSHRDRRRNGVTQSACHLASRSRFLDPV